MADFNDGIMRGEETKEEGGQIMEARRRFVISVGQGGSTSQAIINALADSRLPVAGDAYSGNSAGSDVKVIRRVATPVGVGPGPARLVRVQVDVFYKWMPTSAHVSSSASGTRSVKVTKDKDDSDLEVTHDGDTYILETNKPQPTTSITVEVFNVAAPQAFTSLYLGKVNTTTWNGGAPRTWFCSSVEYRKMTNVGAAETEDAIRHYVFHFEYREDTWDKELSYRDTFRARIPDGIGAAARKKFQIYDETAFQDLIVL